MTQCRLAYIYQSFGGICYFNFRGNRNGIRRYLYSILHGALSKKNAVFISTSGEVRVSQLTLISKYNLRFLTVHCDTIMRHKPAECTLFKLIPTSNFDVLYMFRNSWVHHQEGGLYTQFLYCMFSCSLPAIQLT
jgi:hypothetical protein